MERDKSGKISAEATRTAALRREQDARARGVYRDGSQTGVVGGDDPPKRPRLISAAEARERMIARSRGG